MKDIVNKDISKGDTVVFVLPDTKRLGRGKVIEFVSGKIKVDADDGFKYRVFQTEVYIIRKTRKK